MAKDFLSLADYTRDEISAMLDLAADLKVRMNSGVPDHPLAGKTLAMIFEKPSLRTRVTFEVGMFQLGGAAIRLAPDQIQLGTREPVADCARNLERWVDGIMARTFAHATVEELARNGSIPVINGLTDKFHPCQILADLLTIRERFEAIDGVKLSFVGDGNNVVNSWLNAAALFNMDFALACPAGYEPDADVVEHSKCEATGSILITHDVEEAVSGANVVYTDVWTSMGQEAESERRRKDFDGYTVTQQVMSLAAPGAVAMHCLPAHRGEEISAEVIDGPQSIVFDQAENRLHAQKGILGSLLGSEV